MHRIPIYARLAWVLAVATGAAVGRAQEKPHAFVNGTVITVSGPTVEKGVVVVRAGKIVELADAATLFDAPQHEYTRTLLDAVPRTPAGGTLLAA